MAKLVKTNKTLAEILSSLTWGGTEYPSYEGRLDRAAQGQAQSAANNASNTATSEGSQASEDSAALTPFYRQEMNAQHLFNPEQTNELLNYAEGPAAGSAATAAGKAGSEAARTRNTSGFSSALDEAARNRNQTVGTASEGIGAEDVMGAKELNQEGAKGISGMYGVDTDAMLKAMGIQTGDINSEVTAGNSGWYQNMNATIAALRGAGGSSNGSGGWTVTG